MYKFTDAVCKKAAEHMIDFSMIRGDNGQYRVAIGGTIYVFEKNRALQDVVYEVARVWAELREKGDKIIADGLASIVEKENNTSN